MMLIDPTRYMELIKMAELGRTGFETFDAWIRVLLLMVLILTALCVFLALVAIDQREELQEHKRIQKEEPRDEKEAFDNTKIGAHHE